MDDEIMINGEVYVRKSSAVAASLLDNSAQRTGGKKIGYKRSCQRLSQSLICILHHV